MHGSIKCKRWWIEYFTGSETLLSFVFFLNFAHQPLPTPWSQSTGNGSSSSSSSSGGVSRGNDISWLIYSSCRREEAQTGPRVQLGSLNYISDYLLMLCFLSRYTNRSCWVLGSFFMTGSVLLPRHGMWARIKAKNHFTGRFKRVKKYCGKLNVAMPICLSHHSHGKPKAFPP